MKDVRVITRRPERFDASTLSKLTVVEVESVKIWDALKEAFRQSRYRRDDRRCFRAPWIRT